MRRRPSARLIVLDAANRVLLFRFVHKTGALAGRDYWATPGGGVDPGESFIDAARRELAEETGFQADIMEPHVAEREFILQLSDGEHVVAEERFFVVRTTESTLSTESWTADEVEVMADHRWWTLQELRATTEIVFPENMAEMVAGLTP
ncbi:NUDIX hydrolase [Microvirga alba]|uniref:NUDIX domain-containing protein n=1 Tax=Microvirga alba TaxID=2791025 RepID=A0A931BJC8_9HYPH|nr:NUDIX domain-containing protein [Microvirga alba]MBF9232276.1 NUDIX domain-containing protein [Microvirga alba]